MLEALNAAREKKDQLRHPARRSGAAKARDIAIAASNEFGVPLFDLDSSPSTSTPSGWSRTSCWPSTACCRCSAAASACSSRSRTRPNLHAIDEIKFQTGLGVEAVVVEDDKLQKAVDKAIEQADAQMPDLGDDEGMDLEGLEVTGGDDEVDGAGVTRDDVEDAPIVRFVNKLHAGCHPPRRVGHPLRAVREDLPRALPHGRRAEGNRPAARAARRQALGAPEGHVAPGHRRAPRAAGRPHQDEAVEEPRHRLPRQHLPHALRREDRAAYSRSLAAMLGIDALGYEPFQKEIYLKNLAKPQGMILVTGPTGSGKTVSLYTGLNILNREDTNISTAEDPAEINLPGVNQVNVNHKVGLTFAAALRAFLRQDPDVIMVGEIRDLETAEIAIKAAQTGHLVLSTLHTNDAPQTLTRLVDMGVKPYAIATSVSLIIAQRLARTPVLAVQGADGHSRAKRC